MHQNSASATAINPRANVVGYYLAVVGIGLMAGALGPTLGDLAANTAVGLSEINAVFIVRSLGYLTGSTLFGRLYDLWPGHPLMVGAAVLVAGLLALLPLMNWLWLLLVVMFSIGWAEAGLDIGPNTLLVWQSGENVGPLMNGLHFCFGVGAFVAPLVVAFTGSWQITYWVLAALLVIPALWISRLPSPPIQRAVATTPTQARTQLKLIVLFVALFFLYVGAEIGFANWLYSYTVALGLMDKVTAAYLSSAFWGALTLGRLVSIPLAMRVRPRVLLGLDLAGCVVADSLALFGSGPVEVWASTILMGVSMASFFPVLLTFAGRRMALSAQITSYFLMAGSLGAMIIPWLIGQLFEAIGPAVVMQIVFITILVMCGVFGILLALARNPTQVMDKQT
jgi:fucose permease